MEVEVTVKMKVGLKYLEVAEENERDATCSLLAEDVETALERVVEDWTNAPFPSEGAPREILVTADYLEE